MAHPAARTGSRARAVGARAGGAATPIVAGEGMAGATFFGCLALLVVGPYFRGLFFPMEQMVALLLALGLFCLHWADKFRRGDHRFLVGPLDWAAAGLVLAYVASTAVAANLRGAIQEDMKALLYFLVYWLVRDLTAHRLAGTAAPPAGKGAAPAPPEAPSPPAGPVRFLLGTPEGRRLAVVGAVALTGFWLSVLGAGAAAGTFRYNGAFDGWRIYSALQYPNTLAAYLTAAFFCLLPLAAGLAGRAWAAWEEAAAGGAPAALGKPAAGGASATAGRPWPAVAASALAGAGLASIMLVFVFTYSRGAWLLMPPLAVLAVLLAGRGRRLVAFLGMACAAVAALAASPLLAAGIRAKASGPVWAAFLLSLALGAVLGAAVALTGRLGARTRAGLLGLLGGAVLVAGAAVVARVGLPGDVLQRIRSISLRDYDAWSRLVWNVDALRIVRDHPLLGVGGRGWDAVYHKYQSYGYWTTEVHNGFMQTWVEAGTVGFLVLLAAWAAFAVALVRALAAGPEGERLKVVGAGVGALALGLHSLIDFNLSLSAVSLALWALMAVVASAGEGARRAAGPSPGPARDRYLLWPRLAVYGGSALAAAGVITLLSGFQAGQAGARALNGRDVAAARASFERAVRADPFTASFHVDLAQTYLAGGAGPAEVDTALRHLRRALELEPYNANFRAMHGTLLLQLGRAEEGLAELRRAVELHPFEARWYVLLAQAEVAVARGYLQQGKRAEAMAVLREVPEVADRLRRQSEKVPALARGVFPLPASPPEMEQAVAEARRLLEGRG